MTDEDEVDGTFAIPRRPERCYPRHGGVEYRGETVFSLTPDGAKNDEQVRELLETVLESDAYTYGDWFDLPMPLYLVHDETTGDVFRASVRDGRIRLHVLPATESDGLRRLYDRLRETTPVDWTVDRTVRE